MDEQSGYRFAPVTAGRRADLAAFCGRYGKFGYCSCMRWRLRSAAFGELGRDGRTAALLDLAATGQPAGVLAYRNGQPVGWCSVAPRDSYQAITAARVIPRLPGAGVWSVTCFFLAPAERGRGLLPPLLAAALGYATGNGAAIAEAYPWPGGSSYRYMGTRELYLAAGFADMPVPDGCRPVMRRTLQPAATTRKAT